MEESTYQKIYKMRQIGENKQNTVVTIPPEVVEREARIRNLTIDEFIQQYRVVAQFDGFGGLRYNFQPAKEG